MFVHELPPNQRSALLTIASRMMSADAHLHDMELATLTQLREALDLPMGWRPDTGTLQSLLALFQTPRQRSILMLNLLRVAWADEAVVAEERTFLTEVMRGLGLNKAVVRDLSRWLLRHRALLQEGSDLLG